MRNFLQKDEAMKKLAEYSCHQWHHMGMQAAGHRPHMSR